MTGQPARPRTAPPGPDRPPETAYPGEPGTWARLMPWVGLVARLILGGVLLYAGYTKLIDLTGSLQSVLAYELFGYELARFISVVLPIVEVAVGLLLIAGLLTRPAAVVGGLLMVIFIVGIISAWSRGLSIDCGCFGTGGTVAPEDTRYLSEILRDIGFLALATWLTIFPRTRWSVDALLPYGPVKGP